MYKNIILAFLLFVSILIAAPKYTEKTVSNGVSLKGKVIFEGKIPKPKTKTINKDQKICGDGKVEYDIAEVSKDGSVKAAVVYISKIESGKSWNGKEEYKLSTNKCQFKLESYVVKVGAKFNLINEDKVFHNTHAYAMAGKARITMFNKSQPSGSKSSNKIKIRKKKAHGIKIECDAHNFMHAWAFGARNPYYSVTAENGEYEITDIPPGKYTIGVWHPVLGDIEQEVKIELGGNTQNFTIK